MAFSILFTGHYDQEKPMFTGIIECFAKIKKIKKSGSEGLIEIENPFGNEIKAGDSIAVDGVCLTVETFDSDSMTFFISRSSLQKTIAGDYRSGTLVNLERALQYNGRLDGHIVTGHVDNVASVRNVRRIGKGVEFTVDLKPEFSSLVVDRGSVALNGISLTIATLTGDGFTISLIPESMERTTFAEGIRAGMKLNVEYDILGKYVARQLSGRSSGVDNSMLEML